MMPTPLGASPCPVRSSIALSLPFLLLLSAAACARAPTSGSSFEVSDDQDEERSEDEDDEDERSEEDDDAERAPSSMRDASAGRKPDARLLDASMSPSVDATVGAARESADGAADAKGSVEPEATSAVPPGVTGATNTSPGIGRAAARDAGSGRDADVVDRASCHLAGNQIGVMGDSYLDLSGQITVALQQLARQAGALGPYETYIDRAQSGASMAYNPTIPSQLGAVLTVARERRSAGVKLVIMTGGGNDMLIYNNGCLSISQPNPPCIAVVDQSVRLLKKLFIDMAAAGIRDVIYFGYPNLPGGGLAGSRPSVMNGYATPILYEACESSQEVRCHFIDTRPTFEGHPEYISASDRVHPTLEGSRAIAQLIWQEMQAQCLGST